MRKTHVAAFFAGALTALTALALAGPSQQGTFRKLDVFTRVLSYVENNYVDAVDDERLMYGAAKGLVDTLDPHSTFLTPQEFADLRASTEGEFSGVGIEIRVADDGALVVLRTLLGTPAHRGKLAVADRIIAVDGKSLIETSVVDGGDAPVDDGVTRLRGKSGTKVTVLVQRDGWSSPRSMVLTRELIEVASVDGMLLPAGVAYVRVHQFQEGTARDLRAQLKTLKAAHGRPLGGLILDLRDNPGGLFDEGVEVADLFVNKGLLVSSVGRKNRLLDRNHARRTGTWARVPMVALVNERTASSAEIVAGALQDHQRASLVGTKTFGKGSVQSVIRFGDGSGLKLTVARYLTPHGRSIHEKGLIPDVVVAASDQTAWATAPNSAAKLIQRDHQVRAAHDHLLLPKSKIRSTALTPVGVEK